MQEMQRMIMPPEQHKTRNFGLDDTHVPLMSKCLVLPVTGDQVIPCICLSDVDDAT